MLMSNRCLYEEASLCMQLSREPILESKGPWLLPLDCYVDSTKSQLVSCSRLAFWDCSHHHSSVPAARLPCLSNDTAFRAEDVGR